MSLIYLKAFQNWGNQYSKKIETTLNLLIISSCLNPRRKNPHSGSTGPVSALICRSARLAAPRELTGVEISASVWVAVWIFQQPAQLRKTSPDSSDRGGCSGTAACCDDTIDTNHHGCCCHQARAVEFRTLVSFAAAGSLFFSGVIQTPGRGEVIPDEWCRNGKPIAGAAAAFKYTRKVRGEIGKVWGGREREKIKTFGGSITICHQTTEAAWTRPRNTGPAVGRLSRYGCCCCSVFRKDALVQRRWPRGGRVGGWGRDFCNVMEIIWNNYS